MLSFDDSDWPSIVSNLQIARRKWVRFSCMLGQERANTRKSGRFYVAVVQSVLIFVSESWVTTPRILWVLGSLHNWVAWWIYVRVPWWNTGQWEYPPPLARLWWMRGWG